MKKLKSFKDLKVANFIFLFFAGIINATGVVLFLIPVGLYDGGISGTSFLLSQNTALSLSIYLIILNAPIYVLGYKKLGLNFIIYSLFAISIYSLMTYVYQNLLALDFSNGSPIVMKDFVLCAIFGGIISGVGSGITIRFGGAIDGVEVLGVLYAKLANISIGTFVMIYNCVLYVIVGLIFQSWSLPLYSIVAYACGLKAVDFVVDGFDKAKSVYIITDHYKEIADTISRKFGRGVTILNAQGYYSQDSKNMIYCVVNRFEVAKLKQIILASDPSAFVAICDVTDTLCTNLKYKKFTKTKNRKEEIVDVQKGEQKP